ncbi:MAG TPA: chemotaxis protein CheB [Rhodanobacter sp.]|nr:chemotaxis protein CheB [Rhodanobacter sp.]
MPAIETIVIGCSAGGPGALTLLLGALDQQLPASVIVCSHTASGSPQAMCDLLAQHSALPVIEACEREPLRGGMVQVAPPDYHLLIERGRRFALSVDEPVGFSRPSIDVLFSSAAEAYGASLIAVILTGANADGAAGLACVRRAGGLAIVQQPDDAAAPAMPRAALELAGADHCVTLDEMAPLINRLCMT